MGEHEKRTYSYIHISISMNICVNISNSRNSSSIHVCVVVEANTSALMQFVLQLSYAFEVLNILILFIRLRYISQTTLL
jgi:hypothetical protein